MWNRLRRFSALPPDARALFVRSVVLLPLISLSLKLRGFRGTYEFLSRPVIAAAPQSLPSAASEEQVARCVRMVNAASRHLWRRSTCLEKSLALWQLLRRRGIDSAIRIGARTNSGEFQAHAWVEIRGVPLNEPADTHRHYAAFDAAFPLPTSEPL